MVIRDFCAQVADRLGVPQSTIYTVFTACIEYGREIIEEGDEWRLPGLGKFFIEDMPSYTRKAPFRQEGEITVPPKRKVRFKFVAYSSDKGKVDGSSPESV